MKGLELTVAETLYNALKSNSPGLIAAIEDVVKLGETKEEIMAAIRRRAGNKKVWTNNIELVIDYIIHKSKEIV